MNDLWLLYHVALLLFQSIKTDEVYIEAQVFRLQIWQENKALFATRSRNCTIAQGFEQRSKLKRFQRLCAIYETSFAVNISLQSEINPTTTVSSAPTTLDSVPTALDLVLTPLDLVPFAFDSVLTTLDSVPSSFDLSQLVLVSRRVLYEFNWTSYKTSAMLALSRDLQLCHEHNLK